MAGSQRTMTIKFVGDVKNVTRSVKDIVSGLDDTESAGKRVATAIRQLAGDAEADFADARDAADKLATALGEDTVAEIKAAGRSVDGYIADLQRMGLTYDDVRADVDELALAIRNTETAAGSMKPIQTEAETAGRKIDGMRDSADQSRSVLANMVGNSAQDLGALGGFAGTAGVAIGQLAEYATEGNINMSGLAKVAGPMAGVGVAVIGISWAMGKLKQESEDAKKEAELMLGVQEQIRDGKFDDAGVKLAEAYAGIVEELKNMGVPQDEVMKFILGTSKEMPTFNRLLEENKVAFDEGGEGLTDFGGKLDGLGGKVYDARKAFKDQADQLSKTDAATVDFTEALIGAARETGNTELAIQDLEAAYLQLTGELTAEAAWLSLNENMRRFREDMASGELSTLEQRQALVDVKLGLVDYLEELEHVPDSKQTEILALIDQGKVAEAEAQLNTLARARGVTVTIAGGGGLNKRAAGGPVSPSGVYAVGDNRDGSWNSTTELFVPSVAGRILSASDSRSAVAGMGGGGGGGGNTYITVQVAPTADRAAIGRELQEAMRAADRTFGPVYASVRS